MAALDAPMSYYENVREEYRGRRDTLLQRIAEIPGAKAPKVEGAFYATVRLPIDDGDDFCQWLLESFDLNGRTIMMAPASGFYSTPGEGKDEVRIAYVLNRQKMNEAMDILEAALKVYPGRRELASTQ
jgi:aspartate aminotransferase